MPHNKALKLTAAAFPVLCGSAYAKAAAAAELERYCDTRSQVCTTEHQQEVMIQSGGRALGPRAVGAARGNGEVASTPPALERRVARQTGGGAGRGRVREPKPRCDAA